MYSDNYDLTEENFLLYCAKHYDNKSCHDMEEFLQDVQLIMNIKKLMTRYVTNEEIRDRLVINHMQCLFNVFSHHAAVKLLFFRSSIHQYKTLKTFLVFMGRCPDIIYINNELTINISTIETDQSLLEQLEQL